MGHAYLRCWNGGPIASELVAHCRYPPAFRVLFEYTEKRQDKVSAVYCLTGWTKGADPREVVQLVAAEQLAARRAELQPIRGMHVFSVQPRIPKDPAEIYEPDKAAFDDEMQRLVGRSSHPNFSSSEAQTPKPLPTCPALGSLGPFSRAAGMPRTQRLRNRMSSACR